MTSSPVRRATTGDFGRPGLLEASSALQIAQSVYHHTLRAEVKGIARTGGCLVVCYSCCLSVASAFCQKGAWPSSWCASKHQLQIPARSKALPNRVHYLLAGIQQAQGLQQHLALVFWCPIKAHQANAPL